jgi:SRSO17 transposase
VVATTALLADQLAWPTTMEPFLLEDWAEDADRRARAPPQVTDRLDACAEVRVPGIQIDSVLADAAYGNHHALIAAPAFAFLQLERFVTLSRRFPSRLLTEQHFLKTEHRRRF